MDELKLESSPSLETAKNINENSINICSRKVNQRKTNNSRRHKSKPQNPKPKKKEQNRNLNHFLTELRRNHVRIAPVVLRGVGFSVNRPTMVMAALGTESPRGARRNASRASSSSASSCAVLPPGTLLGVFLRREQNKFS